MQSVHVCKNRRNRAKIRSAKANAIKIQKIIESDSPDYPVSNIKGIRDVYVHFNYDFKEIKTEVIIFSKTKSINRYNVFVDGVFKFVKGKARAWRELVKDGPPIFSERSL